VLSLDGKRGRLVLRHFVSLPESFEKVEAELAPNGFLDHFAVALADSRASHLDGPENVLVDR
jgi:hypothetical protein